MQGNCIKFYETCITSKELALNYRQASCLRCVRCVHYVWLEWKPHLTSHFLWVDTWQRCLWNSHIWLLNYFCYQYYLICTKQHNKTVHKTLCSKSTKTMTTDWGIGFASQWQQNVLIHSDKIWCIIIDCQYTLASQKFCSDWRIVMGTVVRGPSNFTNFVKILLFWQVLPL